MINHKLSVSEFGNTSFFLVRKLDRWSLSKEKQAGNFSPQATPCHLSHYLWLLLSSSCCQKIIRPPQLLKHIKAKPLTHFHGTPLHCSLYNRCLLHCFDFSSHNNPSKSRRVSYKESFAIGRNQQLLDFTVNKAFREAIQNYKKEYVTRDFPYTLLLTLLIVSFIIWLSISLALTQWMTPTDLNCGDT